MELPEADNVEYQKWLAWAFEHRAEIMSRYISASRREYVLEILDKIHRHLKDDAEATPDMPLRESVAALFMAAISLVAGYMKDENGPFPVESKPASMTDEEFLRSIHVDPTSMN